MSETSEPDDDALLHRFCATRDEAAFTCLVRRHLPLVYHVARRRLGSRALAEEAAQAAFARLATKAKAVARHPERLRAWLHRTAHFEACALARKEARLARVPVEPKPTVEPMPRPEIYDQLDEALDRLPELDRELVLRHCCEGEEYQRIAPAVGKSAAACQKRVERALALLARRLGAARNTGAVAAAFAASQSRSEALPAAERLAAAALQQSSLAGSGAGAAIGLKTAACTTLALAGALGGWQPQEARPTAAAPASETMSVARGQHRQSTSATVPILAPRPPRIARPLDEILETIQAGRFAPLVDFLPRATPADLRAIIAEDDIYEYGEIDGKEHFGSARNLALSRWAEIDPQGAFAFAKMRDLEMGGFWLGDTATVIARWSHADPAAAIDALLDLPSRDRVELLHMIFRADAGAAERIAADRPEFAWIIEEQRLLGRDRELTRDEAERIVNDLLVARREPTGYLETDEIERSFQLLGRFDPDAALIRAGAIQFPELRATVLLALYQEHPPSPGVLAPGEARSRAAAAEAERLLRADPEAAIRKVRDAKPGLERNAIWRATARHLAGSDPWRMLELTASLPGPLATDNGAITSALEFAGRSAPRRALALLPDLAANGPIGVTGMVEAVLAGWIRSDPAAAIRMAGQLEIRLATENLRKAGADPAPLLELLAEGDGMARSMAMTALADHLASAIATGTAPQLVRRMPRKDADHLLRDRAINSWKDGLDDVTRIASLASPEVGRWILADVAFQSYAQVNQPETDESDPHGTVAWVRSLPVNDRRAVIADLERNLGEISDGRAHRVRRLLARLQP